MVLSQKLLSPGAPGVLQEREQGSPTQHQAGVAWIRPVMGDTLGHGQRVRCVCSPV